jgi:hypothetical protein
MSKHLFERLTESESGEGGQSMLFSLDIRGAAHGFFYLLYDFGLGRLAPTTATRRW